MLGSSKYLNPYHWSSTPRRSLIKKTMEYLQKLERVQTSISSMQSAGVSSGDADSDRFLAHFLLFMVQPCGSVNMQKRFQLVSQHLQKISVMVLEEEMLVNEDRQRNCDVSTSQSYPEDNLDLHLADTKVPDIATIGLDAMKRANSTLEDFCRSYFMFHGMDVNKPQSIFKFLPMLYFTESYIYQLDIMNEKLSKDMISSNNCANDALHESSCSRPDLFGPLVFILHKHGLLTERIKAELEFGSEYWALERKLCHALMSKRKILIEDVMQAIHLKSFDYRVLNLLLYQLREEQVNELHMEFLSISEFLVEVSDDLYDYEEDVVENSFNILRMFVGVYGASEAPSKLAKCIGEAEEKYERLSKTLDPDLSLSYWRRCEEATMEGGTTSGHSFGTWSIPSVIVDEESYRSGVINLKQS